LSNLSFFSGALFLFSGCCALISESEILLTICLWSVPLLLIALVIDICHKRYWALVPLVILVAAIVLLAIALQGFDIPVGG
jgi:EamA domain-containing membrane protein RarD